MRINTSPSYSFKQNRPSSGNVSNPLFFNEFMKTNKPHPKRQYQKNDITPKLNITENRSPMKIPLHQQTMNQLLVQQNQYLINELMIYREKEIQYKKTISRLKKEKVSIEYKSREKFIEISDKSMVEWGLSTIQETGKDLRTSTNNEENMCKSLLDDSEEYIEHTGRALSTQIEILNQKLCGLLQKNSQESDPSQKKRQRLKISQCVSELKELRRYFDQIKGKNSINYPLLN